MLYMHLELLRPEQTLVQMFVQLHHLGLITCEGHLRLELLQLLNAALHSPPVPLLGNALHSTHPAQAALSTTRN